LSILVSFICDDDDDVTAGATTISADDAVLTLSYGYSQAKMDSAVLAERQKRAANDEG